MLDEELDRLPGKYRRPLVLCYLEGKTRDEAAEELGWSLSTVKRRLDRGRKRLAAQLRRRGVTLGVAFFSAILGQSAASAAVPPTLILSTCRAATLIAAGKAATEILSVQVAALTEGMVKAMTTAKLKLTAMVLVALAVLASGAGLWSACQMQAGEPPSFQAQAAEEKPAAGVAVQPHQPALPALVHEDKQRETKVQGDVAALVSRGDYLVNQVARCGDCHTPRNAKGGLDLSRHLQGAPIWLAPKIKGRGDWADRAPDITANGRAGKWTEDKMIKFLSTGQRSEMPMPAYTLTVDDARAVSAYLRSLLGQNKGPATKRRVDD
jgi:mono/diheme cytochrome c family protein